MKFPVKEFLVFAIDTLVFFLGLNISSTLFFNKHMVAAVLFVILFSIYLILNNALFPSFGNMRYFKFNKTRVPKGILANTVYFSLYFGSMYLALSFGPGFIAVIVFIYIVDLISVIKNKKRIIFKLLKVDY